MSNIYSLTKKGINQYYNNAINKVNLLSINKKNEINTCKNDKLKQKLIIEYEHNYDFHLKKEPFNKNENWNFFNDLPKEIKIFICNEKDYQMIINKLNNIKLKSSLWHLRLKYICYILYKLIDIIGSKTNQINIGIFGSESFSSDVDIGIFYKKNIKLNKNTIKLSEIVKVFENLFIKQDYTTIDLDIEMYANYSVRSC